MIPNIVLETGKQYMVHIAKEKSSSTPIIDMYKDYNPIFIFGGTVVDLPKNNFIILEMDANKSTFTDALDATFPKCVINSETVVSLFKSLLKHQKEVWVSLWKNHPNFQPLFDNPQIKLLGLPTHLAYTLSNKVYQYSLLKGVVPIPQFVATTKKEASAHFDSVKTDRGVFTSLGYGGQGSGCRIHPDIKSLQEYLDTLDTSEFLMINALTLKATVGIDILIANPNEIYVYGLRTELFDGFKCRGCVYPSEVSEKIKKECHHIALTIGKKIANINQYVRGYFNINLNIDTSDTVYFSEVNARYGGSSGLCVLMMDQVKPPQTPKMVDLGIMAMKKGTFKKYTLWDEPQGFVWYNEEMRATCDSTVQSISFSHDPVQLFNDREGIVLMGQLRPGTKVVKNSIVGVIVVLQRTHRALEQSRKTVELLMEKYLKPSKPQ